MDTMLVFALPKRCFSSNLWSVQFSVVYHNLAPLGLVWGLVPPIRFLTQLMQTHTNTSWVILWSRHSLFQGRWWGGSNVFQARNKVKHVLFWGLVIQEADDTKCHKDVNVIICYSYELLPHPFLSHIDSVHCYARSWSARHQRSKNHTDFAIVQCMMSLLRGGTS
jgi:hypothetical protein